MGVTTVTLVTTRPEARSAGPVIGTGEEGPPEFSRAASTGLFVGVQTFGNGETVPVPYAVDDAVDLAYKFSLDGRSSLIPPRRVVLALSGEPKKTDSRERLKKLLQAGAIRKNATSGDILQLVRRQTTRAGKAGMFILSVASHGFLHDGDAYILGSTSVLGSTETSLKTSLLLDIAARAPRSLVFLDTCRDRIDKATRAAGPDPDTVAPLLSRMKRIQGQVIFHAAAPGQYAYDDDVHQNGVFTKAVLDGLACKASASRSAVIVETLHTYVEREVRLWIQRNRDKNVQQATQLSVVGRTRNMPLAQCWRSPQLEIRVVVDGAALRAYSLDTRFLWQKQFLDTVTKAEVADLDADGFPEVVVGFQDRIIVLDRDGEELWTHRQEGMSLRTFITADLSRKHTNQIVALWTDERSPRSRLTILDSDNHEQNAYECACLLDQVAVGRPTNMHAPKIAVTSRDTTQHRTLASSLFLLHPKTLLPVWRKTLSAAISIKHLTIADADADNRSEILVTTTNGTTRVTIDGKSVTGPDAHLWQDANPKKRRSTKSRRATSNK